MRMQWLAALCVVILSVQTVIADDCCEPVCDYSPDCSAECGAADCGGVDCGGVDCEIVYEDCDDCRKDDCCNIESCCDTCCPGSYVRLDVLGLDRSDRDDNQLLLSDTASGDPVLSTDDLGFERELGYQFEAGYMGKSCRGLSVRAFKVNEFESNFTEGDFSNPINDAFTFESDFFPPFPDVGGVDVEFTSEIKSGEINYRIQSGRMTWLIGYRHVELDDSFSLINTTTGFDESVLDVYRLDVNNELDGIQLGTEGSLYVSANKRFRLDGFAKGGLYSNDISIEAESFYSNTGAEADEEENEAAFVGECGLIAVYKFNEHVALRGGYQALWLDGVASGLEQFDSVDLSTAGVAAIGDVNASSLFYQGTVLGIDLTF